MSSKKHYLVPLITSAYVLVLLLGSIYPFTDWVWPINDQWLTSFESETRYVPRSDFIINVLIYVPLGLLISILLRQHIRYSFLLICSTLIASGVGLSMEFLQFFIPSRAHSFIDLMMNTLGSFTGALLHHFTKKHSTLGQQLRVIRYTWVIRGRYSELGLIVIALWALSEVSPLAPALNMNAMVHDYIMFTHHLIDSEQWQLLNIIGFGFEVFALFLVTELVLINKTGTLFIFGIFAGIILYLKIPVADINLSADHFWGLILGMALFFLTKDRKLEYRTFLVMMALIITYAIAQLNHPVHLSIQDYNTFNWLPFDSDAKRINRVTEILSITWIFLALSFFTLSLKQSDVKKNGLIGLLFVMLVTFVFEWHQQNLQDTSADITEVIIPMFAWALPYFHPEIRKGT